MARRILKLRAFAKGNDDSSGAAPWSASVCDINGEVLLVSQFTLHARTHRRSRPDFSRAMPPSEASQQWRSFVELVRREALAAGAKGVGDGVFGAMMRVSLENDGPVTFILDTEAESGAGGGGGGSETVSGATTAATAATTGGGGGAAAGGGS